ncbi:hypothetical protein BGZ51_002765 [Haplosporangium sp. Z 767]|nr:hypothetical protein BGZ51_002765 [Haplosporangium sp. Z 767]KAF9187753.1 hypothetical protein BGZ50_001759 [Haplosporangium sp. Z 11]
MSSNKLSIQTTPTGAANPPNDEEDSSVAMPLSPASIKSYSKKRAQKSKRKSSSKGGQSDEDSEDDDGDDEESYEDDEDESDFSAVHLDPRLEALDGTMKLKSTVDKAHEEDEEEDEEEDQDDSNEEEADALETAALEKTTANLTLDTNATLTEGSSAEAGAQRQTVEQPVAETPSQSSNASLDIGGEFYQDPTSSGATTAAGQAEAAVAAAATNQGQEERLQEPVKPHIALPCLVETANNPARTRITLKYSGNDHSAQKAATDPQGPPKISTRGRKNYMVATDLSGESWHATEWAITTILRNGDELNVVTIVEDDKNDSKTVKKGVQTEMREDAEKLTKNIHEQLEHTTLRDITVVIHIIAATKSMGAKELLIEMIDDLEDLSTVIVGSRGRGAIKGLLLGSISNFLVHNSSVPVMVVRAPKKSKGKKKTRRGRFVEQTRSVREANLNHVPAMNSQHDPSLDSVHNDLLGRNIAPGLDGATPKRILLTGGAGFIGSALVRKLVLNYPEYFVLVIDKLDYCSSLNNLRPFYSAVDQEQGQKQEQEQEQNNAGNRYPNFKFIHGDITDLGLVQTAMWDYKIDTVIHLAAQTHVDKSFGESIDFSTSNVLGTHVMLEAARKVFCTGSSSASSSKNGKTMNQIPLEGKRFIFMSTDEVYGEVPYGQPAFKEDAPLAPSNPYSATKAAAECMAQAYYKSFRLPIIITRCNNVYGPFQYPEKIYPKFIMNLLSSTDSSTDPSSLDLPSRNGSINTKRGSRSGGYCYIHGSGHHSRTYLYVTDAANALDVILHRGEIGQVYNIGPGHEMNNLSLAQDLIHRVVVPPEDMKAHSISTNVNSNGIPSEQDHHKASSKHHAPAKALFRTSLNGPVNRVNGHWSEAESEAQLQAAQCHLNQCQVCASRIVFVEDRAFNDRRYAVDPEKLYGLGWAPKIGYEEGITKTIEWFKANGRTWWGDIHRALYPHSIRQSSEEDSMDASPALSLSSSQQASPLITPSPLPIITNGSKMNL